MSAGCNSVPDEALLCSDMLSIQISALLLGFQKIPNENKVMLSISVNGILDVSSSLPASQALSIHSVLRHIVMLCNEQ